MNCCDTIEYNSPNVILLTVIIHNIHFANLAAVIGRTSCFKISANVLETLKYLPWLWQPTYPTIIKPSKKKEM